MELALRSTDNELLIGKAGSLWETGAIESFNGKLRRAYVLMGEWEKLLETTKDLDTREVTYQGST